MTRLTRFVTACALTGAVAGAAIAACGGRVGSPGELPPMAPHPGPIEPTAMPARRALVPVVPSRTGAPTVGQADAGVPRTSGPVSRAVVVPTPEFAPVVGAPVDAGTGDGYSPPLPPLPDGGVPGDSRMEPRAQS